jgi:hypothetical protein
MWPQSWIRGKTEVLRQLHGYQGATAQPWEYSVSHSQFVLRIHREEDLKGLALVSFYLWMKNCDQVSFFGLWREANIQIEERQGKYGPRFVVSDGEHLVVDCGAVFAAASSEIIRLDDQLQ